MSYGNGIGPLSLQLRSQCGENGATVATTGSPMANEPKRVSRHEKHGKPQGCHERLLHHTTARACSGLRSPRGGEHDSGSTFQPVGGTVGASVLEDTMMVHRVALPPPIHVGALPPCALRREHAHEQTRTRQPGSCVAWDSGLPGFVGGCVAWDSLRGLVMGAMHCMGLVFISSLSCREETVGGGGCLECAVVQAARHTHPFENLALAPSPPIGPLPVSRTGPHQHASLHCCKTYANPSCL